MKKPVKPKQNVDIEKNIKTLGGLRKLLSSNIPSNAKIWYNVDHITVYYTETVQSYQEKLNKYEQDMKAYRKYTKERLKKQLAEMEEEDAKV